MKKQNKENSNVTEFKNLEKKGKQKKQNTLYSQRG
jgi:hypothetical protein